VIIATTAQRILHTKVITTKKKDTKVIPKLALIAVRDASKLAVAKGILDLAGK